MTSLPTTHPIGSQTPVTRLRRVLAWFLKSFTDYDKLTAASDDELSVVIAKLSVEWKFMFFAVCYRSIFLEWQFVDSSSQLLGILPKLITLWPDVPSSAAVQTRFRGLCLYTRFGFPSLWWCPLGCRLELYGSIRHSFVGLLSTPALSR